MHNYSVEQFKNAGYPTDSHWNDEDFLDYDESKLKSDPNTKNKDGKSYNDILSELRDKKRRPKSYKTGKSKSFTEALRDLIGTQMNLLEQLNKFGEKESSVVVKTKENSDITSGKRAHSTDSNRSVSEIEEEKRGFAKKSHKKTSYKKKSKKSGVQEQSEYSN